MDNIAKILGDKGLTVHTIAPTATVLEAAEKMSAARVGALIVGDQGAPAGIFSERDLMTRVILARKNPATTSVGEVMTTDVVCVEPNISMTEAMAIMTSRRCRHLPVVSGGALAGMVSIGDLVRWTSRNQEFEILRLTEYIHGKYPA
jgi:CBS domain-containing protein